MISKFGHRAQAQAEWVRDIGRSAVIKRDGEVCACCKAGWKDLTVDHIKTKGSRADLKRDIDNLQLLCFLCHRNKTDHIKCLH
jgi:5-methylcytosine-specific restriction endonuclease McrA